MSKDDESSKAQWIKTAVDSRNRQLAMPEAGVSSKARWIKAAILIVVVGSLVVVVVIGARQARHAANRISAYGHLYQIRLALRNYTEEYGTLPQLTYNDDKGNPLLSWRLSVLSYISWRYSEYWKDIDRTEPWNSPHNRKVLERIPPSDWGIFARDASGKDPTRYPVYTYVMALRGADSAWDAQTGRPKGPIEENPDAILLISVPESTIEPLQPGDVTEDEVRKMVEDGKDVYFIRASGWGACGVVTLEDGKLVFRNWKEVHD